MKILRPFISGLCMGVADLVPGISGGTMAFILGVYEPLLESIGSFRPRHILDFLLGRWGRILREINALFLFPLVLGMALSIFSLSGLFHFLLNDPNGRSYLFSAFLGLVLASAYFVAKKISKWRKRDIFSLTIGAFMAAAIVFMPGGQAYVPHQGLDLPLIFYGALASSAMLLPGVSGSYILTILGVYPFVIGAVMGLNVEFLGQLFIGIAIGALVFSRFITFLLKRAFALTLGLLTGFMLGSLPAVWPFEQLVPHFNAMNTWVSVLIATLSFFLVVAIEQISLYTAKKRVI